MIVLLNGPPEAGKDTAARIIANLLPECKDYKISKPLKEGVVAILGFPRTHIAAFEEDKDEPSNTLNGHSYREAQIRLFEDYIKPMYGSEALGHIAIRGIMSLPAKNVTVSDAGLSVEVKPILDHFGRNKVALLEIHRPGHDFTGDIRQWIDEELQFIHRETIQNQFDLDLFEIQIKKVLKKWNLLTEQLNEL